MAAAVLVLDQLAKWLVVTGLTEGTSVPVVGELLRFTFVRNPGAAFSLGVGATWIFAIIAATVAVVIVVLARRIRSWGWAVVLGLLLGGTLGNLGDRLFREPGFGTGYVIDFLQLWGFPAIFNLADVAITAAVVMLVILVLMGIGFDGERHRGGDDETARAGAADGDA